MFVIEINKDFDTHLEGKRNPGVEIILVTSGYLIRECNFHFIRINSNEIHFSISQQPTSIIEKGADLQGWYCCFDQSFLDQIPAKEDLADEIELISSFLYQYPLRLDDPVFRRLNANFNFLNQLYRAPKTDSVLMYAYLVVCIYEIKKVMKENNLDFYPAKAFSITKKYNDLLDTFIEKEQHLEFYAQQLNITPNHLNKSVKSVTGKTAITLLNEVRLIEIKSRLKNTNSSISEIAYDLGFEDQSYFSRFFKKKTGLSPIEFRKENKLIEKVK